MQIVLLLPVDTLPVGLQLLLPEVLLGRRLQIPPLAAVAAHQRGALSHHRLDVLHLGGHVPDGQLYCTVLGWAVLYCAMLYCT